MRQSPNSIFIDTTTLRDAGLTLEALKGGIDYTYHILDMIDTTLIANDSYRLSQMMELANLSTFVGNLLGAGIANSSNGAFNRNGPHKYPDLLAQIEGGQDVEIKVALEDNKPKGHLAKPGYYLICRYTLGDELGNVVFRQRADVVWIWELRFGLLTDEDFNKSNTEGDSGKTAVVNKKGMKKLEIVYIDRDRMPFSSRSRVIREYHVLYSPKLDMP